MRERVQSWLRRYGFAEVAGLATALAGSSIVFALTGNDVAAAYGAVFGENIGFYGLIGLRQVRHDERFARGRGEKYGARGALRTGAGLAIEFGPAELLDSLVIRPTAIAFFSHVLGRPWGVVVGKLAADVTFYVPVIIAHEMQKRFARTRGTS